MTVIAVDFDGCLCESAWPEIGKARTPVINELRRRQADGARLILWTCREGELLAEAVMWCLNRGLRFDAVNDNIRENVEKYHNNCRKVWADEYWDDKNVLIVGEGKVTSMAYPREEGGMIVREWGMKELKFIGPEGYRKGRRKWWPWRR